MDPTQYAEFIKQLEATGERRDFEVIIRGVKEIQLTREEISEALYTLVNTKAEAVKGTKPHFDVEVSTYSFDIRSEARS